jgi:hypothetical protein
VRDPFQCSIVSVPGSAVTKRAGRVSSGILVHQATESSYCVETKEYMGVIDLYGGGDWERFSVLPSDPHAPSSTFF